MLTPQRVMGLIVLLLSNLQPTAAADAMGDISVNVEKREGAVLVDARMAVNATQQQTWEVLTDYNHMAQFFPNLTSSRIAQRNGNKLRVEQKGKVSYGPFAYSFYSVRAIELIPVTEIRSRAVSGSLKSGFATTRLVPQGAITWVVYHSESEPAVWVPPAIGSHVIAGQTRAQFESLRAEIMKRKNQAGTVTGNSPAAQSTPATE